MVVWYLTMTILGTASVEVMGHMDLMLDTEQMVAKVSSVRVELDMDMLEQEASIMDTLVEVVMNMDKLVEAMGNT